MLFTCRPSSHTGLVDLVVVHRRADGLHSQSSVPTPNDHIRDERKVPKDVRHNFTMRRWYRPL